MKTHGLDLGLAVMAIVLLTGCEKPRIGDLRREWAGDKYLTVARASAHKIEIRYLPRTSKLLNASGLGPEIRVTNKMLDSLNRVYKLGDGITFLMRISPLDSVAQPGFQNDLVYGKLSGHASYQEAMQAFLFGLKGSIWIEADGKKIPLANYQMENNYGITPDRKFMLLFPEIPGIREGRRKTFQLVMDDIVPGLARKKIDWAFPVGKYDEAI